MEWLDFVGGLFVKDGELEISNVFAGAAVVVSLLALWRSWNWKPKPKIKFQTDWKEDSPRQQGAYDVYFFEAVNVGGLVALDVQIELNRVLDGAGGSLRASIRMEALSLRVGKSALHPGEHIPFTVSFQREHNGVNPLNPWAPFRTKDLELKASYRIPPVNRWNHSEKKKIDGFVKDLPAG